MHINKDLKYYQGSDSENTKSLLIQSENREFHGGDKDSAVWILRLKAQGLEVISYVAILIFKPICFTAIKWRNFPHSTKGNFGYQTNFLSDIDV